MFDTVWDLLPWISWLIFTLEVKWFYHMTHGQFYIPNIGAAEDRRPRSDGIGAMAVMALIIGIAICIMIDNTF